MNSTLTLTFAQCYPDPESNFDFGGCKRLRLEFLDLVEILYYDEQLQKRVVSLGVTLRMAVELNSNSNVTIEIISKTKTKARN